MTLIVTVHNLCIRDTFLLNHRHCGHPADIFSYLNVPCSVSAFVLIPDLLIRSLLLCRDKDGVDVVEERPWTSLLMFEDSLALLDRLYRLSIFRERLKRQRQSIDVSRIHESEN